MIEIYAQKQREAVPFGPREFTLWVQWFFIAIFLSLLYMPILVLVSWPKILRYNHMFVVFWVCLGLDYGLKRYFSGLLANDYTVQVIPGFMSFTLVHNKGATFGLLKGWGWLFILMAVLTGIFILFYLALKREQDVLICWALTFILAGAAGNCIDRIQFNYVIDYILLYYKQHRWPVFNFADMIINLGVILIGIDMIRDIFSPQAKEE